MPGCSAQYASMRAQQAPKKAPEASKIGHGASKVSQEAANIVQEAFWSEVGPCWCGMSPKRPLWQIWLEWTDPRALTDGPLRTPAPGLRLLGGWLRGRVQGLVRRAGLRAVLGLLPVGRRLWQRWGPSPADRARWVVLVLHSGWFWRAIHPHRAFRVHVREHEVRWTPCDRTNRRRSWPDSR